MKEWKIPSIEKIDINATFGGVSWTHGESVYPGVNPAGPAPEDWLPSEWQTYQNLSR